MTILVLTFLTDFLLSALLAAFIAKYLFDRPWLNYSKIKGLAVISAALIFLNAYYLPALVSLDLTVSIGNQQILKALDLSNPIYTSSIGPDVDVGAFIVLFAQIALSHAMFFKLRKAPEKKLSSSMA